VARRAPRSIGTKIAIGVVGAGVVAGAVVGVKVMTSKNTNAVEPVVSASGSVGVSLSPGASGGPSASAGGGTPTPPPIVPPKAATLEKHRSFTGGSFSLRGFSCDGVHGDWTMIESLSGTVHGKLTFVWSFANGKSSAPLTGQGSFGGSGTHFELHGNKMTGSGNGVHVQGTVDAIAKLLGTTANPKITFKSTGTSTVSIIGGASNTGSTSGSVSLKVKLGAAPECA
jgi:hypothetical protein